MSPLAFSWFNLLYLELWSYTLGLYVNSRIGLPESMMLVGRPLESS